MSSIDEVIERSRQPGEFSERKTFTVARSRAIHKLRHFALVDPHFYILELIQSAISNGASYIDIRCEGDLVTLSYVGGNFRREEIAQLFDFLFASRDDVEHGPLRQLALGVNALMLFEPDEIVIETGDGTAQGTHRVELGGDDSVEVGRPQQALDGTFLRATGLNRRAVRKRSSLEGVGNKPPEYRAIEERCLTAPVPILFNHEPVFGYSRQRTPPSLFGFGKTIRFDEGDLYGTIGVAKRRSGAVFRLLTHGVWIESRRRSFGTGQLARLGGIVAFDGLRKTADHSSIVDDERLAQMWLRLRPYIDQLARGQAGKSASAGYDVRTLSNTRLETPELLELFRNSEAVAVVDFSVFRRDDLMERARQIGTALDAPILAALHKDLDALRGLAGRELEFYTPSLRDEREVELYTSPEISPPDRPWLISPVDLGTLSLLDVGQHLAEFMEIQRKKPPRRGPERDRQPTEQLHDVFARISDEEELDEASIQGLRGATWLMDEKPRLGDSLLEWIDDYEQRFSDCIRARIYTPAGSTSPVDGANVLVRHARRHLWSGRLDSLPPEQILVIDITGISPGKLWQQRGPAKTPVVELIAEALGTCHFGQLERAANRALRAALHTEITPGTNSARLLFGHLCRGVVKRIRSVDGSCRIQFSPVDQKLDLDVLDKPFLTTLDGQMVSLRTLMELMEKCHGLLYAVRTDIASDLQGLDRSRIVVVDAAAESLLVSLVGPTAFARVDERHFLASDQGVQVRDIAVGLRDYPDFPLLVEGVNPENWPIERQKKCLNNLFDQLLSRITSSPHQHEDRRQAWRHLQWLCFHGEDLEIIEDIGAELRNLPLFRLSGGRTCSYASLRSAIDERDRVEFLDGWAHGAGEMPFEKARERLVEAGKELEPMLLTMNPFVVHLVGQKARGVAEYHLSEAELSALEDPSLQTEALLESMVIDDERFHGVMGIPLEKVTRPAVLVFEDEARQVILRDDLGDIFGVVGKVRLRPGVTHDDVDSELDALARDLVGHLLSRLPELERRGGDHFERALSTLLGFADSQLRFVARSHRTIGVEIGDRLARQILNAPLFSGTAGVPISAMSVLREFRHQASLALSRQSELDFEPAVVDGNIPGPLRDWIDDSLHLDNIHRPTRWRADSENTAVQDNEAPQQDRASTSLAATLSYWLEALHPRMPHSDKRDHLYVIHVTGEQHFQGRMESKFCTITSWPDPEQPDRIYVNLDHELSQAILDGADDEPRTVAWALLALFAEISNLLGYVDGDHELTFQRRVTTALVEGRLDVRKP